MRFILYIVIYYTFSDVMMFYHSMMNLQTNGNSMKSLTNSMNDSTNYLKNGSSMMSYSSKCLKRNSTHCFG